MSSFCIELAVPCGWIGGHCVVIGLGSMYSEFLLGA